MSGCGSEETPTIPTLDDIIEERLQSELIINPQHIKRPLRELTTISPAPKEITAIAPIPEYNKEITLNEVIDEFNTKNNNIIDTFGKLETLIVSMPENQYIDNVDKLANVLYNVVLDDERVFKTIEEAKTFLDKVRNKNNRRNRKKWLLPKRFYKIVKERKQIKEITPMLSRDIKPNTITRYIYNF